MEEKDRGGRGRRPVLSTEGLRFRFSCTDMAIAEFVSTATALRAKMFLFSHTQTPTHKQAHKQCLAAVSEQ